MNYNKLYVPIKSVNLGHYFSNGCICPVKYITDRNSDIQNIFDLGILLCKEIHTQETDCSLEIQLTKEEEQRFLEKISDIFFLYKIFIPISRVSKIIFKEKKQAQTTIWNIQQTQAFIPNSIISISDIQKNTVDLSILKRMNNFSNNIDNASFIEKYNRLLGGFALMKLSGKVFMNYSINYFNTLSNISTPIRSELDKVNKDIIRLMNTNYDWLILGNRNDFKNLRDLTYSKINEEIFSKYANEKKIKYEKRLGKIALDSIDKNSSSYIIAILASYNNLGARQTLDNFISDLIQNKFPIERKEGISLMFGINKGYNVFRNYYKTDNFTAFVKFKLENIIDYHIIESIYQFVISLNIDIDFSFVPHVFLNKIVVDKKKYYTYSIFDNDIIYDEKEIYLPWYKRIYFSEVINILISNFEKKVGLKLNNEQRNTKSLELSNLLFIPLDKLYREIETENLNKINDINNNYKNQITEIKNRELLLLRTLRNINSNLYDSLNIEKDNQLNNQELDKYIYLLKNLKYSNIEVNTNIIKDQENKKLILKDDSIDNKYKEDELNRLSLDSLKEIAKVLGLKGFTRIKKDEKYRLIKIIMKEEKSRLL